MVGRRSAAEQRYARRLGARMLTPEYVDPGGEGVLAARPLKVAGGVFIHAVEVERDGVWLRASLRVHGEAIVAARVEPTAGLDHAAIERALVGAPVSAWRERRVLSPAESSSAIA